MKTNLIAGVDNQSLDIRQFDISLEDIKYICRFFSIGKLLHYEREKDIIVSHSNFYVFVKTTLGKYALKFYPPDSAKTIAIEYAINRLLIDHHFHTPFMHTGKDGKPFLNINNRLSTCFTYINGHVAWQDIKKPGTFLKINASLLSLKNILSGTKKNITFPKQNVLMSTINSHAKESRGLADKKQKKTIDASLLDACRIYKQNKPLFTRRLTHNNANLNNFIFHQKNAYTLDLSHIKEDYVLSDLASMVISCQFFEIPSKSINLIVKDYFSRHQMGQENLKVLNTLITTGLIREYLKNIKREKSDELYIYPAEITRKYKSQLYKRIKIIQYNLDPNQRIVL